MFEGNLVYWENEAELKAKVAKCAEMCRNNPNLMRDAVLIVERQVKENAGERPGPRRRTGRLWGTIKGEVLTPLLGRVGTSLQPHYAPDVEFGHMQTMAWGHYMKTPKAVPAYPFFGPAPEQVKGDDRLGGVMITFGKTLEDTWSA